MNGNFIPQYTSRTPARIWRAVIIVILLSLVVHPVFASTPMLKAKAPLGSAPRVAPPNSHPYGKTYGEWGAEWWKYALSYPADINPINDPTGANCGMGQTGPVFFLMGGMGVRDECTVPAGKALFFPLVNFFCAVPEDGATSEEIRSLCSYVTDYIDSVTVTVDGVTLQNPMDYRFPSPDFSFTGAVDNPWDTSCGTPGTCYEGYRETAFTDGYWVLLFPLPVGEHTINFGGHFILPEWGWEFSIDMTYNLTVANHAPTGFTSR
jgi:hypothetical protein